MSLRYKRIVLSSGEMAERREMLRGALARVKAAGEVQRIERVGGGNTAKRVAAALTRGDTYAHPWLGGKAA